MIIMFCFFLFQVGGQFTANALPHMKDYGRVALCGAISTYNDEKQPIGGGTLTSKMIRVLMLIHACCLFCNGYIVP